MVKVHFLDIKMQSHFTGGPESKDYQKRGSSVHAFAMFVTIGPD